MAWNYYAVRKGIGTGIVESWEECKQLTLGVSGAEYKGFNKLEDAERYLKGENVAEITGVATVLERPTDGDTANVFVKGSYVGSHIYIGIVIEGQVQRYMFFGESIFHEFKNMRGFLGELYAVMVAGQLCREIGFTNINIMYNYDGVEKWANGSWIPKGGFSNDYFTVMNNLRVHAMLKYNFIKRDKNLKMRGISDAESMVTRAENVHQYVDLDTVLKGALTVRDVPLYSIS